MSRAVASVRVVNGENVTVPRVLIRQCAATLTELDSYDLGNFAHEVLPRCTRLESVALDHWRGCPPAVARPVAAAHAARCEFCVVPATAIAAALPRLHTLHVDLQDRGGKFPVAASYDELLPRLRSFHIDGRKREMSRK
jgi:hypothetical protein